MFVVISPGPVSVEHSRVQVWKVKGGCSGEILAIMDRCRALLRLNEEPASLEAPRSSPPSQQQECHRSLAS